MSNDPLRVFSKIEAVPEACLLTVIVPLRVRDGHEDAIKRLDFALMDSERPREVGFLVVDVPMGRLLEAVDEVHVLTSLAGFEALLRGKPVTTHGCPFYAGWGLTRDFCEPIARRGRLLKIDELVAAALILYPVYVSRVSKAYTTPERALWELRNWDSLPPDNPHWSEEWLRRLGMFWILRNLVAR